MIAEQKKKENRNDSLEIDLHRKDGINAYVIDRYI